VPHHVPSEHSLAFHPISRQPTPNRTQPILALLPFSLLTPFHSSPFQLFPDLADPHPASLFSHRLLAPMHSVPHRTLPDHPQPHLVPPSHSGPCPNTPCFSPTFTPAMSDHRTTFLTTPHPTITHHTPLSPIVSPAPACRTLTDPTPPIRT
jgi:hypothetical protein